MESRRSSAAGLPDFRARHQIYVTKAVLVAFRDRIESWGSLEAEEDDSRAVVVEQPFWKLLELWGPLACPVRLGSFPVVFG